MTNPAPPKLASFEFDHALSGDNSRKFVFKGTTSAITQMKSALMQIPGLVLERKDGEVGGAELIVSKPCKLRKGDDFYKDLIKNQITGVFPSTESLGEEERAKVSISFQQLELAIELLTEITSTTPVDLGLRFDHAAIRRNDRDFHPIISVTTEHHDNNLSKLVLTHVHEVLGRTQDQQLRDELNRANLQFVHGDAGKVNLIFPDVKGVNVANERARSLRSRIEGMFPTSRQIT